MPTNNALISRQRRPIERWRVWRGADAHQPAICAGARVVILASLVKWSPPFDLARPGDRPRLVQIAAEGDFNRCESRYFSFIAEVGRLLCTTSDGEVVAFAGMVPVGDVAMVTDLFVANAARGRGVGGRLLAELLDDRLRRMTFSAQHLAALAAYRREGMEPAVACCICLVRAFGRRFAGRRRARGRTIAAISSATSSRKGQQRRRTQSSRWTTMSLTAGG